MKGLSSCPSVLAQDMIYAVKPLQNRMERDTVHLFTIVIELPEVA